VTTSESIDAIRSSPQPFGARLWRCLVGLLVCGCGIALIVAGDIGLAPWDVLHDGLSERTGMPIGTSIIVVGFALLLVWIPLRVRPGLGTILNAIEIGLVVDVVLPHLPEPDDVPFQLALMLLGVVAFGAGTGLYIGAGLGPGPRDGLMTGLSAQTGHSIRLVRTVLELGVFAGGWALGGEPGIGTAVFALTIGPIVQWFLHRMGMWSAADSPSASEELAAGSIPAPAPLSGS
jgi:uncharacterized membrane protein YczE